MPSKKEEKDYLKWSKLNLNKYTLIIFKLNINLK